jgi:hypothetical protein
MAEPHLPPLRSHSLGHLWCPCRCYSFLFGITTCNALLKALRAETVCIIHHALACVSLTLPSIIRILVMIPIYAVVSFLSYLYYRHAVYFELIRDCYEAFAIASFFTLMCHYIAPNLHEQKEYFRSVQPKNWVWPLNWMQKCTGGEHKGFLRRPRSGLTWFNVRIAYHKNLVLILTHPRLFGSPSSNTASFAPSSPL